MIKKTTTIWKSLGEVNKKHDTKLYIQNDFINDKRSKENFSQRKYKKCK